jgi:hypothetical protein
VRQIAGQEHKRSRPGFEPVLAAFCVQCAGQQVQALVLAVCVCFGGPASTVISMTVS